LMKIVQMARYCSKYIFKAMALVLFLSILAINAQAQDSLSVKTDTVDAVKIEKAVSVEKQLEDTVQLFRSGMYIKIDYGKLLTYAAKFEDKLEGELGVVFLKRVIVNAAYGTSKLDPLKAFKNIEFYTIEGNYMRFGLEYQLSINPRNFLSLGMKYSMSNYSDKGRFLVGSEFWEDYQEEFGSDNLHADWVELVMNTETTLGKNLYLGTQFSWRYMLHFDTRTDIPVYAIPGYGRHFDKSIPAANLFIRYKIPF